MNSSSNSNISNSIQKCKQQQKKKKKEELDISSSLTSIVDPEVEIPIEGMLGEAGESRDLCGLGDIARHAEEARIGVLGHVKGCHGGLEPGFVPSTHDNPGGSSGQKFPRQREPEALGGTSYDHTRRCQRP